MGHLDHIPAWSTEDAEARFSDLIRKARDVGPQRVTVHGRDAAVVLSAEEFERLSRPSMTLVQAMEACPVADFDLADSRVEGTVRDVDL